MYIVDASLDEAALQAVVKQLEDFVSSNGGEVVASREFGRRRLAFEINKHTSGTYMILYFNSFGELVPELQREFYLVEGVVRGIICVANPKALFDPKPEVVVEEPVEETVEEAAAEAEAVAAEEIAPEEAPAEEAAAEVTEEAVAEEAPVEEVAAEEAPAEEAPAAEEAVTEEAPVEEAPAEEVAEEATEDAEPTAEATEEA